MPWGAVGVSAKVGAITLWDERRAYWQRERERERERERSRSRSRRGKDKQADQEQTVML